MEKYLHEFATLAGLHMLAVIAPGPDFAILEALGPESLDWQFITSLLDRHPNICQRMAEHNRAEFSGQRMLV